MLKIGGTPISPNPSSPDQDITVLKFAHEFEGKSEKCLLATPVRLDTAERRNFKMTKRLFDDIGSIPGCIGCEAMDEGLSGRIRSKFCREIIAQELDDTGEGKKTLKSAQERSKSNLATGDPEGWLSQTRRSQLRKVKVLRVTASLMEPLKLAC